MNNRYREEEKEEVMNEENKEVVDETTSEENDEVIDVEIEDEEKQKLQEEVKRLNDLYLRTLAETENFKKRINEERIRERKYATQSLMEKMINTLDIFDKVVNVKTDDEKLKNFLIGFEMINNQLKQIVADEGVKPIESLGVKFNPSFHHAVETAWEEDKEEDIILEELQRGYTFKDRVLRAALVKVNKNNQGGKQ